MTEYRDDIEEIEEDDERTFGEWLQDNLRIIISVIIVLLLALGIYSYSKRSQDAHVAMTGEEIIATDGVTPDDNGGVLAQIGKAVKDTADKTVDTTADAVAKTAQVAKDAAGSVVAKDDATNKTAADKDITGSTSAKTIQMTTEDKEVADAFVMAARAGDGKTHLARRALAGYLAKNSTQGLTDAHKIYIEDYLQKVVGGSQILMLGEEVRFSKDMINQAISRSKSLTEAQLTNLQKYVR